MKNLSDERLVALYAKGNNEAFDILLSRHQSKLFSYINFIVKNTEIAEDIFQETFVKAIVTIKQDRYTDSGKFAAWLTRIAHNLIIDMYRQDKNNRFISNDECEFDIFNNKELCDGTIEDDIVNRQIHCDLRKIIETLPENQKEVVQTSRGHVLHQGLTEFSLNSLSMRSQSSDSSARGRGPKHNPR